MPEPALDHAILAFRELPDAERHYWREIFDHFVFNNPPEVSAHLSEGKRGPLDKMTKPKAVALCGKLARYFQR